MNKKSLATLFMTILMVSMSTPMTMLLITPAYATHKPIVTLDPTYSRGIYPEWKSFNLTNEGPDAIVKTVITYPVGFKPAEYKFPEGWTATPEAGLRQIIFESIDYATYNILGGSWEIFGIRFQDGPTEEGSYEFIVSTTDAKKDAYTLYIDQIIDKTRPTVEIIYPPDGSVIRGGLWINATASDALSGVDRVELYINEESMGDMTYDSKRDVYYWYTDGLPEERVWYEAYAEAFDKAGNSGPSDTVTFFWYLTWGITIVPTSGPIGTTVIVSGVGFTPDSQVNVTFYNTIDHGVVATALVNEQTLFETSFKVPGTPGGFYTVNATDAEGISDAKTFEVIPWITITPTNGIVGTEVTVTGTGFPAEWDIEIWYGGVAQDRLVEEVSYYETWDGRWTWKIWTVGHDYLLDTVLSNSLGSFETTFDAPESWGGYHPIWAQWWVEVEETPELIVAPQEQVFRILPSISLEPSSGVSGQYVRLLGTGFSTWEHYEKMANEEYEIYIRGDTGIVLDFGPNQKYVDEYHDILNNEFNEAWMYLNFVPMKIDALGTIIYYDSLYEKVNEIGSPFLKVPSLQPSEYTVTAYRFNEAEYSYTESASTTFTIEPLQIDASEILARLDELEATIIGVTEDAEGNILAVIETNLGTITARFDQIDATLVDIQGDIATISTKVGQIQVKVEDINGEIVDIKGDVATIKTDIGTIKVDLEDIQAKLVDIQGDIATISTTLGDIETKIDNLGTVSLEEIKKDIATIKSDIGTIKVNVSNINANITSIKGRFVTIETTVGTIQEDIDDINGKIVAIEGETATIKTDIGTIKTSLTDINTKIKVTNDNVATIQTDIGTIKGRLTTIEGDVATIETDIGTVKTSTTNIEKTGESIKSDTSLQPATVALSLIAAIGAIAAAAMVLRKVYMK